MPDLGLIEKNSIFQISNFTNNISPWHRHRSTSHYGINHSAIWAKLQSNLGEIARRIRPIYNEDLNPNLSLDYYFSISYWFYRFLTSFICFVAILYASSDNTPWNYDMYRNDSIQGSSWFHSRKAFPYDFCNVFHWYYTRVRDKNPS